jgi:Fe-S-cluster containining protein
MFPCTKCGLCCRNIDTIHELKDFDKGNGICIHLTEDNLCNIYDERPDICNVEKMFERKYKRLMSKDEYYRLNLEGCKKLQEEHIE